MAIYYAVIKRDKHASFIQQDTNTGQLEIYEGMASAVAGASKTDGALIMPVNVSKADEWEIEA